MGPMAEMTVEERIHEAIEQLTSAERRAARGLLANYPMLGLAPVAEFAKQAGASPATVLRFIARLGFKSYPDFQRALRDELQARTQSPLQRSRNRPRQESGNFLTAFAAQLAANISATASRIPQAEFDSACRRLADTRRACHLAGGRFTDALAAYMEAHLRLVRPGVRRLDGRMAARVDQLLDVKAGDTAILFDMRRYDPEMLDTAKLMRDRRAFVVLITDEWISPAARFAKVVLPCRVSIDRTWDANTAMFALVEALIARTTELAWPTASQRISANE